MDESKMAGVRERQADCGGEGSYQGQALIGGEWLRISYERRDGRIQVQYLLFGAGGYVHSVIDGNISAEAERWHNDVHASPGPDYGINRIGMVSRSGWLFGRMVGEVDAEGARRLVEDDLWVD